MSITKKEINGNEYSFYNSSRGNRSGFVHESKLYKNGRLIGQNKIQYYNRTWECYTYQSVMKGIVGYLLEDIENEYKVNYKLINNIKRLTEARKNEMIKAFSENTPVEYLELAELYSQL